MLYHLFVYGSLLNVTSASPILKSISLSSYQPFFFPNVTLGFDVPIPVETATWKGKAGFLNLRPGGAGVDGMLIHVNEKEFEFLRVREKHYAAISRKISGMVVHTFSAESNDICYPVLSEYVEKVLYGARQFDQSFYTRYLQQIESAMCDHVLIDGYYKFEDLEINRLTNINGY